MWIFLLDRRFRAEETASEHICSTGDSTEHVLFCLSTADEQEQNTKLSSSESVAGSEDDEMTIDDVDEGS